MTFRRTSAVAMYDGFSLHYEGNGAGRDRFVLACEIERADQIPLLRQAIDCIESILQIGHRRNAKLLDDIEDAIEWA